LAAPGQFAHPSLGNGTALLHVVDHHDELMGVVTVDNFYVHTCLGHASRYLAELPRFILIQALDEHFANGQYSNAGGFKRLARDCAILDEEVRNTATVHQERPSAFETYSRPAESFAHIGQRTRAMFKRNRKIVHPLLLIGNRFSAISGRVSRTNLYQFSLMSENV
jgi:hypothetical protein